MFNKEYKLLDEIHPGRIKNVEEWFRWEDRRGRELVLGSLWERAQSENVGFVLKVHEDKSHGALELCSGLHTFYSSNSLALN